jgi:uncharacterized protein (DUF305 family)
LPQGSTAVDKRNQGAARLASIGSCLCSIAAPDGVPTEENAGGHFRCGPAWGAGRAEQDAPASTRLLVSSHLSQADVTFMQCMIMHHSQAVEMTVMIPAHTGNKDVLSLGAKISSSQMDEINFMKRWLIARHQPASMAMPDIPGMDMSRQSIALMPGMLTVKQMEALRQAKDAEFDRLFLAGMIQHHKGALIMVKDLFNTPGTGQDAGQGSEHGTLSYRCDQGSSRDAAGGKGGIEPSRLH